MDLTIDKSTRIGLGYAAHSDAFQCGREAAQAAKGQLPDASVTLALIVGPPTVHFKDFVEGARLAIGEECLVAIPAQKALSNETNMANACFVVAFQTTKMRISIAADEVDSGEIIKGTTSLLSQFKRQRGNALRELAHRGCLSFSHQLSDNSGNQAASLAADMGFESWVLGGSTLSDQGTPMVYLNKTMRRGLVGIEFLSRTPWGVGSVAVDSFPKHADVYREAIKTALREASAQMPSSSPPRFGLILFDVPAEQHALLSDNLLSSATQAFPNVPLLAISASNLFVRRPQRAIPQQNDSIVALLVPE